MKKDSIEAVKKAEGMVKFGVFNAVSGHNQALDEVLDILKEK